MSSSNVASVLEFTFKWLMVRLDGLAITH